MKNFKIALCGLFQTGKSTTINALVDGREICAQSSTAGIRTSACNIYICGSEQEKCQLELISDDEICFRLSRALDCRVERDDLWQYQRRELLWRQLIYIWQYEDFKSESIEEASLLLSGLGFLPMLRKKAEHMSVEQASRFGKAPEDELIRWSKFRLLLNKMSVIEFKHLLREEFPVQEVLYPFVKNIFVQANVAQLRKNNICIIDTPGLSANQRDTATAIQAVRQSDAVIYILGGTKEPSEFERQFLYDLHSIIEKRSIIFAVNCQKKESQSVMRAIQAVLQMCGYETIPIIYNAALALREAQGFKLMEVRPLRALVKTLISKARSEGFCVSNVSQAWSLLTVKDMAVVSMKDSKSIGDLGLCNESIEILKSYSNFTELIYKVKSQLGFDK